jgi:hypothetical protein
VHSFTCARLDTAKCASCFGILFGRFRQQRQIVSIWSQEHKRRGQSQLVNHCTECRRPRWSENIACHHWQSFHHRGRTKHASGNTTEPLHRVAQNMARQPEYASPGSLARTSATTMPLGRLHVSTDGRECHRQHLRACTSRSRTSFSFVVPFLTSQNSHW